MFVYVLELCKSEVKWEEVHARKWKLYAAMQDTA
jgi:hypothetical protein